MTQASARGTIMRLIGRNTDAVNVTTTIVTTYKYTASSQRDIKKLNEGNLPQKLAVALNVLKTEKHTVDNLRWDYRGGFTFDVIQQQSS